MIRSSFSQLFRNYITPLVLLVYVAAMIPSAFVAGVPVVAVVFLVFAGVTYAAHRQTGGLLALLFIAVHTGIELPHIYETTLHGFTWVWLLGTSIHVALDGYFFYHEWRHDRNMKWIGYSVVLFAVVLAASIYLHEFISHTSLGGYLVEAVIAGGITGCAGFHLVSQLVRGKCSHSKSDVYAGR